MPQPLRDLLEDTLPLDGLVRVEGIDYDYVYCGWSVRDFNQCALRGPDGATSWFDRATITAVVPT